MQKKQFDFSPFYLRYLKRSAHKKKEKIMHDSDSMLYETAPPTAWKQLKIRCKMDLMIESSLDKTCQSESASGDQCCPLVAELTLQLKTMTCWLLVELQPAVMNVCNYWKIFCSVAVTLVSLCRYSDLGLVAVFFSSPVFIHKI